MKRDLKIDSMLKLKAAGDCKINRRRMQEAVNSLKGQLVALNVTNLPECRVGMPNTIAEPAGLEENLKEEFKSTYQDYKEQCETSLPQCRGLDLGGDLAIAERNQDEKKLQREKLKDKVEVARNAYAKVVANNQEKNRAATDTEATIQAKAKNLANSLNELTKVSPSLADRVKGSALVELLTAAASGKSDTTNPDLAAATEVAKSIPSLAQSIARAEAAGEQVPVSHLLLALNNLMILRDRDDRLAALDDEEFELLKRKIAVREKQANLWRAYSDNLCKLAISANKEKAPGVACDTIRFSPSENPTVCKITLESGSEKTISNCVLTKSWRSLFNNGLAESMKGATSAQLAEASRELHEAAGAYLQIRLNAYGATLEEFRRIDVAYRRSVVQREAALAQWKNVVALPASELEGYYNGGVKPAEIADLLVKALGFTAIAIGVSK